ncbi:hypothetical protein COOONC_16293 [Cooperia oncophora]
MSPVIRMETEEQLTSDLSATRISIKSILAKDNLLEEVAEEEEFDQDAPIEEQLDTLSHAIKRHIATITWREAGEEESSSRTKRKLFRLERDVDKEVKELFNEPTPHESIQESICTLDTLRRLLPSLLVHSSVRSEKDEDVCMYMRLVLAKIASEERRKDGMYRWRCTCRNSGNSK